MTADDREFLDEMFVACTAARLVGDDMVLLLAVDRNRVYALARTRLVAAGEGKILLEPFEYELNRARKFR